MGIQRTLKIQFGLLILTLFGIAVIFATPLTTATPNVQAVEEAESTPTPTPDPSMVQSVPVIGGKSLSEPVVTSQAAEGETLEALSTQANLLQNGSFELGPNPGSFLPLNPGDTSINNWTVISSSVPGGGGGIDYLGTGWRSSDGSRSLDLNGTPGVGGIYQDFTTTPGQKYVVSFDLAGHPSGLFQTMKVSAIALGSSTGFPTQEAMFSFQSGTDQNNLGWQRQTWEFTAETPQTRLQFESWQIGYRFGGPALDNVSVSPRTYAISGTVYIDKNTNDKFDKGDNSYKSAILTLDTGQTANTDSDGNYSFTNLPEGKYTVTLTLPDGYTNATPNQVTITLNDNVSQNFGIISCIGDSGFDICHLKKGDILFETANGISGKGIAGYVGSYWFHTALYAGEGQLLEAAGPITPISDQVRQIAIQKSSFYKYAKDWTVTRLKSQYQSSIDSAVVWAQNKAEDPNVVFMWPVIKWLNPDNKSQDSEFYCALFVWRAFKEAGPSLDLDFPSGYLSIKDGAIAAKLLNQVLPDDIYSSAYPNPFGYDVKTDVVIDPNPSWSRWEIILYSPADIAVTDSSGNITGLDPQTGTVKSDIPNSYYSGAGAEPEWVSIGNAQGTQIIQVKGTGTGSYHLALQQFANTASSIQSQVFVWETTPGQVDSFSVNSSSNGTIILTPSELTVPIDIKPGSSPAPINVKSNGVIPVAILSTAEFDATKIDAPNVEFGPNKATASANHWHLDDVNGDGKLDMVLQFETQHSGITADSTRACLTGKTTAGLGIKGCDAITIVK